MVRFSAALNRLVEVVAHRVSVGDVLEVRRVAGLDVVKAERTRTLSIDERRWGGLPLLSVLTVCSTQAKRSFVQPEGLSCVACSTLQSSCCHI